MMHVDDCSSRSCSGKSRRAGLTLLEWHRAVMGNQCARAIYGSNLWREQMVTGLLGSTAPMGITTLHEKIMQRGTTTTDDK